MKVKSLSRVRLLATPWTAALQAPPSTLWCLVSQSFGFKHIIMKSLVTGIEQSVCLLLAQNCYITKMPKNTYSKMLMIPSKDQTKLVV